MPGETTSAATPSSARSRVRSHSASPAASALARASGLSSHRSASAPPAASARAVASPDRPRPSTATLRPSYPRTAIIAAPSPLHPGPDIPRGRDAPGAATQRSFSVASPISASTRLMIQNRITICGSAQPFFSKWWWIGAIRKTRLPVRLK